MTRQRAVFLDRDGTINVEKEYLHRAEEFVFIPGAPEAIRLLKVSRAKFFERKRDYGLS